MRRILILLTIISIWIVFVASSPVVTGAKVRMKSKKYEETVQVLEENKGKYPDDPELFYYLARAYAGIAQWADAGKNFSVALEKNPDRELRKEIDKYRDNYWAQFVKEATALLGQKRFTDAIGKFQIANIINPERKESYENLGIAYLEQAQIFQSAEPPKPDSANLYFDSSIESLKKAIELDPQDEQFQKNLGQAYIAAGKEGEAVEVFEQYLEKFPDDITAQKKLATIYMTRKEFPKAVDMYDGLLADAGVELSAADYFNAGTCYYQEYMKIFKAEDEATKKKAAELLGKAADAYTEVVAQDPTDCESGEQLYYICITQEKWQEVIKTIEMMLTNGCERSYVTLSNLSVAYTKINNMEKAKQLYEEAQAKKPNEGGKSN